MPRTDRTTVVGPNTCRTCSPSPMDNWSKSCRRQTGSSSARRQVNFLSAGKPSEDTLNLDLQTLKTFRRTKDGLGPKEDNLKPAADPGCPLLWTELDSRCLHTYLCDRYGPIDGGEPHPDHHHPRHLQGGQRTGNESKRDRKEQLKVLS